MLEFSQMAKVINVASLIVLCCVFSLFIYLGLAAAIGIDQPLGSSMMAYFFCSLIFDSPNKPYFEKGSLPILLLGSYLVLKLIQANICDLRAR